MSGPDTSEVILLASELVGYLTPSGDFGEYLDGWNAVMLKSIRICKSPMK